MPETNAKGKKRNVTDTSKEDHGGGSLKRPRRAAACKDFKEKCLRFHEEKFCC